MTPVIAHIRTRSVTREWLYGQALNLARFGTLIAAIGCLALPRVADAQAPLAVQNPSAAQTPSPAQTPSAAPMGHNVGLTKCAACHFQYYENWRASPHGKAFDILPAKYRQDASCLKCHQTSAGTGTGTESAASVHQSTGVSCEACHGPGSEHANLALSYVGQEKLLSEDALRELRAKIQKSSLDQCIKCHTAMAHKPHPAFDRDEILPPPPAPPRGQVRATTRAGQ